MRFAGTWNMYSKSAMPQLARIATTSGFDLRLRRCAYHANVMNTFEHTSSAAVFTSTVIGVHLPVRRLVVLEELSPHMAAGVHAADDRVHDARGAVHDVERGMEPVIGGLPRGDLDRIFVRHPSRVHAVHVDAV